MTKKYRLNKWQKEVQKIEKQSQKRMSKEIWKVYNQINKDIRRELKPLIENYEQLPEYQKKWTDHLVELERQMRSIVLDSYTDKDISTLANGIAEYTLDKAREGYMGTRYQVEGQLGEMKINSAILDRDFIRQSIANPVDPNLLSNKLYNYRDQLAKRTTDVIRTGTVTGKSYKQMARMITRWTESTYKQALRIAHTEGHRTSSEAKQKALEDLLGEGVEGLEKMWLSALDGRVRSSHRHLDGQTVPIDGEFTSSSGYKAKSPGTFGVAREDINCRCTMVTVVDGQAPRRRRDRHGNVIPFQTYKEWEDNYIRSSDRNRMPRISYLRGGGRER